MNNKKMIIDGQEMQTIEKPIRCTRAADGWCQKLSKKTHFTKGICEDGSMVVGSSCHDGRRMCGYIYRYDQWKQDILPLLIESNRVVYGGGVNAL